MTLPAPNSDQWQARETPYQPPARRAPNPHLSPPTPTKSPPCLVSNQQPPQGIPSPIQVCRLPVKQQRLLAVAELSGVRTSHRRAVEPLVSVASPVWRTRSVHSPPSPPDPTNLLRDHSPQELHRLWRHQYTHANRPAPSRSTVRTDLQPAAKCLHQSQRVRQPRSTRRALDRNSADGRSCRLGRWERLFSSSAIDEVASVRSRERQTVPSSRPPII